MKILYGVQTTGHGHLVRSQAMVRLLKNRGHEVHTLLSGPPVGQRWSTEVFEPHVQRSGLTFVNERGRINYLKTATRLRLVRFARDILEFKPAEFDLVITDYEPLTARIAKLNKLPCVGIGHMYAFAHRVPLYGRNYFAHWIMRNFAPASSPLGLHWHHFDQPLLPPTIPEDVPTPAATTDDNVILVYMAFEHRDQVRAMLEPLTNVRFRVYDRHLEGAERHGHIEFIPAQRAAFVEDLARCSGVICNSGFSLISEALHLGKKVLTRPLQGQVEQESNALALDQLGMGRVMHRLDRKAVTRWLHDSRPAPMAYPDVMEEIATWLDRGQWDRIEDLAERVWPRRPEQPGYRPAASL